MSTPGVFLMSGCPCKLLPICLSVFSSSLSKYPNSVSAPYKAGATCPFESTNLSLLGDFGSFGSIFIWLKNNTVIISVQDNDPPG